MTRWEYHFHAGTTREPGETWIAKLGKQGWELVQVLPATGEFNFVFVFKRPIPSERVEPGPDAFEPAAALDAKT